MNKEKLNKGDTIRYWHPRKGGWYHAILVRMGREWATVSEYWPSANPRRHRIPVGDVKAAVL